jgi:glycosyltransferase involved in cell wall biosynthesis
MCVYNGGPYLQQQLDSIATQSELPVEMVVLDDGSADGSWELLQAFAGDAPFPVHVERNRARLGVARNFERAVAMLDQDIVFLADQDDSWNPDKIARIVDRFTADPALGLLHTDAGLVDAADEPLGRTLFGALLITQHERSLVAGGDAYKVYARRNLVTGATCAFRRTLLDQARPFSDRFLHDDWLAFIASVVGRVEMLDVATMKYRLHNANTVGIPLPGFGWRLRNLLKSFATPTAGRQRERADRLDEVVARARTHGARPDAIAYLSAAAAHARFRANLPRNPFKRLLGIARERAAGHYRAWSSGPVSMIHDLLISR